MAQLSISQRLVDDLAGEFREAIRSFAADRVAPGAAERDRTGEFPISSVRELGELGYLGILVPEMYGGSAGRLLDYVILIEELAYACGSTSTTVMTQVHAMLPLLYGGDDEQRQRWLPMLCDGTSVGAFALTEPGAGSDVMGMASRAVPDGDDYLISGSKTLITNGSNADQICVFARTADGRSGISAFLVGIPTEGLSRGRPFEKLGMRASDTSELFFDGVRVGAHDRLGPEGSGWTTAMAVLDISRLSTAAQSVGLARYALDRSVEYSNEREQFGRTIGSLQAVKLRLAQMYMRVEQARSTLYALVSGTDTVAPGAAAAVKTICSDAAMWVTTEAVQAFGGAGYLTETGVERGFRDAKATQIYDGTNDINRIVLARDLLEVSA